MGKMSYIDLLRARRKSGTVATMTRAHLSEKQQAWRDGGVCIQCGQQPQREESLICRDCATAVSMDDIRQELAALRKRILGDSGTSD